MFIVHLKKNQHLLSSCKYFGHSRWIQIGKHAIKIIMVFFSAAAIFPQSCHKFKKNYQKCMMTENLVDASDSQISAATVFCASLFPDRDFICSSSYDFRTLSAKIWSALLLQEELPVLPTRVGIPLLWSQSFHLPLIFLCTTSSTF